MSVTNEFDMENPIPATETRSGKLTVAVIKSYVGASETDTELETEISCEITGSAVERNSKATGTPDSKVEQSWALTDSNSDGKLSVGDVITFGSESFYVSNTKGDDVQVISAENLLISSDEEKIQTGLQGTPAKASKAKSKNRAITSSFIGTIAFDKENNSSDYETSTIKKYVESYKASLNEIGGQISRVGLMTKEDLERLGCTSSSCASAPSWLYSTSYWISAPNDAKNTTGWRVDTDGDFGNSGSYNTVTQFSVRGARPAITVPKDQLTWK